MHGIRDDVTSTIYTYLLHLVMAGVMHPESMISVNSQCWIYHPPKSPRMQWWLIFKGLFGWDSRILKNLSCHPVTGLLGRVVNPKSMVSMYC